jgi:TetR/AcrR family transcriptional repressor of nem operon
VFELLANRGNPAQGIRDVFEITLFMLNQEKMAMDYLLVNTVNELSPIDAGLRDYASEKLSLVEGAFVEACERAQAQRQMNTTISADEAGKMIMTCMIGLRVQSRGGIAELHLCQSITPLLNLLMPAQRNS